MLKRIRYKRSRRLPHKCIFVSVNAGWLFLSFLCFGFVSDLRRSPRIKKLARRYSNAFYSSSQPRSRNLERALSASQLTLSDGKISEVNVKTVRSPMRLLFGAADSPSRPSDQSGATRATRSQLFTDSSVFEVRFIMCQYLHPKAFFLLRLVQNAN